MCKPRPPLFKWRHFEPAIITCAVGWYLRVSLSYKDVEALLTERGSKCRGRLLVAAGDQEEIGQIQRWCSSSRLPSLKFASFRKFVGDWRAQRSLSETASPA